MIENVGNGWKRWPGSGLTELCGVVTKFIPMRLGATRNREDSVSLGAQRGGGGEPRERWKWNFDTVRVARNR